MRLERRLLPGRLPEVERHTAAARASQTGKFCAHISLHSYQSARDDPALFSYGGIDGCLFRFVNTGQKFFSSEGRGASSSKGLAVNGCVNSRWAAWRKLRSSLRRSGSALRRAARGGRLARPDR